jgi:hypothetical protein
MRISSSTPPTPLTRGLGREAGKWQMISSAPDYHAMGIRVPGVFMRIEYTDVRAVNSIVR